MSSTWDTEYGTIQCAYCDAIVSEEVACEDEVGNKICPYCYSHYVELEEF